LSKGAKTGMVEMAIDFDSRNAAGTRFFNVVARDFLIHGNAFMKQLINVRSAGKGSFVLLWVPSLEYVDKETRGDSIQFEVQILSDKMSTLVNFDPMVMLDYDSALVQAIEAGDTKDNSQLVVFMVIDNVLQPNEDNKTYRMKRLLRTGISTISDYKHEIPTFINAFSNHSGVFSCNYCGKKSKLRCMNCRAVCYCDRDCQKKDWKEHKHFCSERAKGLPKETKLSTKHPSVKTIYDPCN
jgi:hypothetical protein